MLDKIGKYKIVRKIGRGAMGEVYEARDPVLNRKVAIKTISGDLGGDSSLRRRFEREAQSAAQLSHPNIITVYDFGQEQELLYMAMELLEGSDLKQAISKRSLKTLEQKMMVMEQICEAMEVAHAQSIVHRDLKPANIHLQPDGQVKIMDFGLARLSGSEMTRTGMVMGTPNYMAPEQVRGERADTRSDIFALGCVFYEILAGRKPFEADSMHAVLFKVMQEAPVSLREQGRDVPVVLIQVVERALAKDPALRFQHAGELREAVGRARAAVAAGKGFEPLPGLELPDPGALGASPGSDAGIASMGTGPSSWGSTSGSGGSASASGSMAPRSPVLPMAFAGAAAALVVAGGLWFFLGRGAGRGGEASGQVDRMAQALVASRVEVARRHLEAGDYREALAQAERALALVQDDAAAKAVFDEAQAIVSRVDAAEQALQSAREAGDADAAARALWELMQVDPGHPAAAELAPAGEAAFEAYLEPAREALAEARQAAAGAAGPQVRQAETLAKEAEADAAAERQGTAVRKMLRARDLYRRAGR